MDPITAIQPRLNYDILSEVMSFCDRAMISSMSRTCSNLHRLGSRLLLKDTVEIRDPAALESLCRFLRAGNFSRMRYLRDLELRFDERIPRRVARQLVEILSRSTHLESLTLADAEPILQSHEPALSNTIAALTTLRTLSLFGTEELARDMMLNLQSPLEEVRFAYNPSGDTPFDEALEPEELPEYHPLFLCQNFAATLEDLDCRFGSPHTGFTYPELPVYPSLRCLRLEDDWPVLRPWIASCPNLAVLSSATSRDEDPEDAAEWDELRQRNLDDQRAHGSWTHLEQYTGDVLSLYILGLACRVPSLTIDGDVKSRHVEMLQAVLAEAKPGYLRMCMVGPAKNLGDRECGVAALLHPAGASELETLDLSLWTEPGRAADEVDSFDFQAMTAHMLEAVAYLPALKHVDLDIRRPRVQSQRLRNGSGQTPDADEDLELVNFGRRAIQTAPGLIKVEILVWYPEHQRRRRFVRVTKQGEDIVISRK